MGLKLLNKIKVSIRALSGTKAPQSYIFYHLRKPLLLCADFNTDRSKSEHHIIRIIMITVLDILSFFLILNFLTSDIYK